MSDPRKYTVGWICALSVEYVAAQEFLDAQHEGPISRSANDTNHYTLGKISEHNIVIAVLPDGEYGTASAASVATNMMNSFCNVRIGLMVGIGGGVPSQKHDIRLGDVVVSAPRDGWSGVFQYDFGKSIQGQSFQHTRFLNQPPTILRTAMAGIQAHYKRNGHHFVEAIDCILSKNARLRCDYKRPEPGTDRLFEAEHLHVSDDCATHCIDDLSRLVRRHERTKHEDNPIVHYGLIASANRLMKDALMRDRLAAERDVLCFETEAGGLMNTSLPCLVIRGICDYADTHKSNEWQGYASMVAAAYARDLLYSIAPSKVEAEQKMEDLLFGLQTATEAQVIITRKQLRMQENLFKQRWSDRQEECLQLFRLASSTQDITYEWYKNSVKTRAPGTCDWLLNHVNFKRWLEQDSGPLLVSTDPGCGKSVLAKYLIDEKLPRTAAVCYFFFKAQDQNTIRQALCALLHQLFLQKSFLIKHAMDELKKDGPNLVNSTQSLWAIMRKALQDPQAGSTIFVLDALDECNESEAEDLIRNIAEQLRSNHSGQSKLKYLLTSRPYEWIICKFMTLLESFPYARIPGEEESESISREVNLVIRHRVEQLAKTAQLADPLKSRLATRLFQVPHRTYLWIHLVFDFLEKPRSFKKTLDGIDSIIASLPTTVCEAYERILKRSKKDPLVRKALCVILAASRPLTVSEMNIALNVNIASKSSHDLDLESDEDFGLRLRNSCGLFVSIYHNKIYFVHQTAREFLLGNDLSSYAILSDSTWQHSITSKSAHAVLLEVCVVYLDFFNNENMRKEDLENGKNVEIYPFFEYSANNWGTHCFKACINASDAIVPSILRICSPDSKSWGKWFSMYWGTKYNDPNPCFNSLMISCYFGLETIFDVLIKQGLAIDSKDNKGRTALSWAARNGHQIIVQRLLERGTDFPKASSITPLIGAWCTTKVMSILGHASNLKVPLLFRRMEKLSPAFNAIREYATPLTYWKKVEKMVDRGDEAGRTPLHWAILKQHTQIVEILLQNGASIDFCDNELKCALHLAAEIGYEQLFQQLLQSSQMLEAKDCHGRSPLLCAVENLQVGVADMLARAGAQVNVVNNMHQNPLHVICRATRHKDRFALLEYFISQGTSTGLCDVNNMTPFLYAVGNQSKDLVLLLLDNGFDVNFRLQRRCWTERMENFLVTYDIDESFEPPIRRESSVGLTALHFSALNGMAGMTALLLNHGSDTNALDENGDTPLHLAIRCQVGGHKYDDPWMTGEYAVETLNDIITDYEEEAFEIREEIGRERESTVQQLLKSQAICVNVANNEGEYPLHVIPFGKGKEYMACAVLSALLDHGAQVSSLNFKLQTCLHLASKAGSPEGVRILLDKGCDIELLDVHGLSPVHYAVRNGLSDIIQLMFESRQEQFAQICIQCDSLGKSMLHHHTESEMCSSEVIGLLLKVGCDVGKLDANGNSALSQYLGSFHFCIRYDTFQLLRQHSGIEGIRWTDRKQRNLLHLLMRQWSDDNVRILEDLMDFLDITTKDGYGMGIAHHGAIHGAFNKPLTRFLQEKGHLELHTKDFSGKTPLEYAEEVANCERDPDLFEGIRWEKSLQNMRDTCNK